MELKIQKINSDAKLPFFAYNSDAGMDLFAYEECEIAPFERKAVGTGIKLAVPEGYAGFVWDKSGLALGGGITTLAGVLDSGYRGELKIVLLNIGKEPYRVNKHQKIAQLVIKKIERPDIVEDVLDDTERGKKGFGSSGLV